MLPNKAFIGHHSDMENKTGCTVFLFEDGARCSLDRRGGALSTRQTDPLEAPHIVSEVDAILVSGGSALGLGAADGVVQFLKERNKGFEVRGAKVPRVPTACLFDLFFGKPVPPKPEDAYKACESADKKLVRGSIGAGTGATVGKVFGVKFGMKGGFGIACAELDDARVTVAATVNSFGDIRDGKKIIAGVRKSETSTEFVDTLNIMSTGLKKVEFTGTTICVAITDVYLTKEELRFVAMALNSSMSRVVVPAHTPFDGDISFAVSCGDKRIDVARVVAAAYILTSSAILDAVKNANGFGIIPAYKDVGT